MKVKRISLQAQKYGFDISLLFITIFLCIFGLIMVYSASYYTASVKGLGADYYFKRQLLWDLIGLGGLLILAAIPYRIYKGWLVILAYVIAVVLAALTSFTSLGYTAGGRTRWITLFGVRFQTAEVVKIAVILFLSWMVMTLVRRLKGIKLWGLMLLAALLPAGLILTNDLSSAVIIIAIPIVMIVVLNRSRKFSIFLWVVLLLLVAGLIYLKSMDLDRLMKLGAWVEEHTFLHEYQLRRIYIWNSPGYDAQGAGYQVLQGLYAIGSGGLFGKGLGASTQKLGFVPEASNDMIFSILCEELGLFGAICLILLYIFLLYRMLRIANRAEDAFGSLIVIGVMAQIAVQVVFHIAVVTNVLPNTGISLPFISYGGTSSSFLMAEVGLVLSVGMGRREKSDS